MQDTPFPPQTIRPDVYDPARAPALFAGVRRRRILAFLVDVCLVSAIWIVATGVVFLLGLVTLGLAWYAFAFLWPAVALAYTAFTLGGPASATPGMQLCGLTMRLWYGARAYPLLAAAHLVLFWMSCSVLTPFVLLVSLFNERKRLLHDLLLGVVIVDADAAQRLDPAMSAGW